MNRAAVARELLAVAKIVAGYQKPELYRIFKEDVEFLPVQIKMPDGSRVKYIPKKSMGTVFWRASENDALMDYFQVTVPRPPADWGQDPSKPFNMTIKMAFGGGHIQREVNFIIKPRDNVVKGIESYLDSAVPVLIERYLKRHGKQLAEQTGQVSESLAEYYQMHEDD